jgi:hypothetical protein
LGKDKKNIAKKNYLYVNTKKERKVNKKTRLTRLEYEDKIIYNKKSIGITQGFSGMDSLSRGNGRTRTRDLPDESGQAF